MYYSPLQESPPKRTKHAVHAITQESETSQGSNLIISTNIIFDQDMSNAPRFSLKSNKAMADRHSSSTTATGKSTISVIKTQSRKQSQTIDERRAAAAVAAANAVAQAEHEILAANRLIRRDTSGSVVASVAAVASRDPILRRVSTARLEDTTINTAAAAAAAAGRHNSIDGLTAVTDQLVAAVDKIEEGLKILNKAEPARVSDGHSDSNNGEKGEDVVRSRINRNCSYSAIVAATAASGPSDKTYTSKQHPLHAPHSSMTDSLSSPQTGGLAGDGYFSRSSNQSHRGSVVFSECEAAHDVGSSGATFDQPCQQSEWSSESSESSPAENRTSSGSDDPHNLKYTEKLKHKLHDAMRPKSVPPRPSVMATFQTSGQSSDATGEQATRHYSQSGPTSPTFSISHSHGSQHGGTVAANGTMPRGTLMRRRKGSLPGGPMTLSNRLSRIRGSTPSRLRKSLGPHTVYEEPRPPLVLLHATLLPLKWHWKDLFDGEIAALDLSDEARHVRECWRMLRDHVDDTMLERGILLPHPQDEYGALEDRLLESLELPARRRLKVLACGHHGGSQLLGVGEGAVTAAHDDVENGDEHTDMLQWCHVCRSEVRYDVRDSARIFRIKVFASNGLISPGAWEACWRDMERVDVEMEPVVDAALHEELERLVIAKSERRHLKQARMMMMMMMDENADYEGAGDGVAHEPNMQEHEEHEHEQDVSSYMLPPDRRHNKLPDSAAPARVVDMDVDMGMDMGMAIHSDDLVHAHLMNQSTAEHPSLLSSPVPPTSTPGLGSSPTPRTRKRLDDERLREIYGRTPPQNPEESFAEPPSPCRATAMAKTGNNSPGSSTLKNHSTVDMHGKAHDHRNLSQSSRHITQSPLQQHAQQHPRSSLLPADASFGVLLAHALRIALLDGKNVALMILATLVAVLALGGPRASPTSLSMLSAAGPAPATLEGLARPELASAKSTTTTVIHTRTLTTCPSNYGDNADVAASAGGAFDESVDATGAPISRVQKLQLDDLLMAAKVRDGALCMVRDYQDDLVPDDDKTSLDLAAELLPSYSSSVAELAIPTMTNALNLHGRNDNDNDDSKSVTDPEGLLDRIGEAVDSVVPTSALALDATESLMPLDGVSSYSSEIGNMDNINSNSNNHDESDGGSTEVAELESPGSAASTTGGSLFGFGGW